MWEPIIFKRKVNEGSGVLDKASFMCLGRHHAAGWALTDHPPPEQSPHPPPNTHTLTYSLPCQTLEIPHIPSTSLAALQPSRDNKGMGER